MTALEGVQRADILGGRTFAMRIWLKPDRMAALNINPAQIRDALAANNFLSAVGRTKGSLVQVNLTANTDLQSVEEFRNLVVRRSGDKLVRLRDMADVVLGAEDYDTEVRFGGQQAVFMGVWPLPNANSLDVIRRVRAEMESIQKELPSGLEGGMAYDATKYIEDAIREVLKTLSETLLIVAIVIFLFLGSLRSVLVPLVAIPISLIGGIFLMQVFGFTLNLLTLLAIVLSVGLVVDDAIVIVENVERHVREGQTPIKAAMLGARELVSPVIAMTITLAAVYAPIGLQGGLTGSLFREFAFTLAGAVFISGVVALTLSPVMSSQAAGRRSTKRTVSPAASTAISTVSGKFYGRVLEPVLSARPAVYIVWVALSLLAIPMFMMAPKELAPSGGPELYHQHHRGAGGCHHRPDRLFHRGAQPRDDEIHRKREQTFQITFPDNGFAGMVLKPWGERKETVFKLLPKVQARSARCPGHPHHGRPCLRRSPAAASSLWNSSLPARPNRRSILEFAKQLQQKAAASGMFAFPPIIDTKDRSAGSGTDDGPRQSGLARPEHGGCGVRPRRRWSAATSSTGSTSKGAATRSFRR